MDGTFGQSYGVGSIINRRSNLQEPDVQDSYISLLYANILRCSASSLLNRQQTRVSKMGGVTTWVSCMTLCLWDNIFGPRVEQVF